jgi:hypothetical protein
MRNKNDFVTMKRELSISDMKLFIMQCNMPCLVEPNESSGGQNKQGMQFDTADLN